MNTKDKTRLKIMIAIVILVILSWILGFLHGIEFMKLTKAEAAVLHGDESIGGWGYIMEIGSGKVKFDETDPWAELIRNAIATRNASLYYILPPEDIEILERIVEAEATGGTIEQKMNVVSCVLARIESTNWPNTMKGVVFDNDGTTWQFSPISDGRYFTVKITDSTREAVKRVCKEGKTHSCLYFCSYASYNKDNSWHRRALKYGFKDGMHIYCN